jgi:hypothetical protein
MTPVGYGYRSVDLLARSVLRVEVAGGLAERKVTVRAIDQAGVVAAPANSHYSGQVTEAGRRSILNGGCTVTFSDSAGRNVPECSTQRR